MMFNFRTPFWGHVFKGGRWDHREANKKHIGLKKEKKRFFLKISFSSTDTVYLVQMGDIPKQKEWLAATTELN